MINLKALLKTILTLAIPIGIFGIGYHYPIMFKILGIAIGAGAGISIFILVYLLYNGGTFTND